MLGTDGTVGNAGVGTGGIVGAVGIGTVGAVGTTGAVGAVGRDGTIATVPGTKITSVRPDQNCAPPRIGLRCVRLCLRLGGVARPERADLWGDFAMTDGEITR